MTIMEKYRTQRYRLFKSFITFIILCIIMIALCIINGCDNSLITPPPSGGRMEGGSIDSFGVSAYDSGAVLYTDYLRIIEATSITLEFDIETNLTPADAGSLYISACENGRSFYIYTITYFNKSHYSLTINYQGTGQYNLDLQASIFYIAGPKYAYLYYTNIIITAQ
jgi:hypothetical protein